ncbi:MAG: hypothetical protein ABIK68_06265 [bacterium]
MKNTTFNHEEINAFAPCEKIGLISCVNPAGLVHMALITSIMASSSTQLTLGQFCTGLSKWYIQENNKVSFLIMTLDKRLWRGRARWTHKRFDGPEYEIYNDMPMFRYNTYFGINTVHYLDLVDHGGEESLPLGKIVPAALMTMLAKGGAKSGSSEPILKPFAENLFNQLGSLKFLSTMGTEGYPVIIPIIQCQASGSRRLVFSNLAYQKELSLIQPGTSVTVFCTSMTMQNVLVRGTFNGFRRQRLLKVGSIDIDWVYNSMPPNHEQIYPKVEIRPVVNF